MIVAFRVVMGVGFAGCFTFILLYAMFADWRGTPTGRLIMALLTTLAVLWGLATLAIDVPIAIWFGVLIVFAALSWILVISLWRVQHIGRRIKESGVWTKLFWKQALERAIKSGAQVVVLVLGVDVVGGGIGIDIRNLDFLLLSASFGGGALLSILTSLVSVNVGQKDSPSLVETTE